MDNMIELCIVLKVAGAVFAIGLAITAILICRHKLKKLEKESKE